jgi:hypothetical protein
MPKIYPQADLDNLIRCTKVLAQGQRTRALRVDGKQKRSDITFVSEDGLSEFYVYFRQSTELPEDFSVGLIYKPLHEKEITLVRCNGDHGGHLNRIIDNKMLNGMHVHYAKEESLRAGCVSDHYAYEVEASDYSNFEEAIEYFKNLVNLSGWTGLPSATLSLDDLLAGEEDDI